MMGLVEELEKLILDPDKSTSPGHCIEEYNAGVLNAIIVVKEILNGEV